MQPSRDLLIFPCNGNGLEALDCLTPDLRFIGFVDDTPAKQQAGMMGFAVLAREALVQHAQAQVLAVPGSPTSYKERLRIIASLGIDPARFATLIHPSAQVSPRARIGRNVLVMAGAVITSNAVIGDHVCVLPNSVIHHDTVIGEGSLIGSNVTIAGSVKVGRQCYIGSGTSIMNGLEIGDGALLGLGTNVIRSVTPGSRVVGNPARPL
ncbi:MAG: NeuD/PglB/VioB family sugar acetyltransferase [Chromatiales bacterium]|jgi:sugar O-acyltransferase (sialic acid O-acetyltransferase NeuD family)|nr:NeuD/PglB/VioB family sugar acetyltransferase [Chromatiales bacterium]